MNPAQLLNPKAFKKANGSTVLTMSSSPPSLPVPANLALNNQQYATTNQHSPLSPSPHSHSSASSDFYSTPDQSAASMSLLPIAHHAVMSNAQDLTYKGKSPSKKNKSDAVSGPPIYSIPSFDPAALLNPKSGGIKRPVETPPNDASAIKQGDDDEPEVGMTSLIERVHRVGKRETQSQKRQKTEHDDEDQDAKKRGTFTGGGGKGGIIGDYMKMKREEGQKESGPLPDIVDLSDDDVVFVRSNVPDPTREVCLGVIYAQMNAHRVPVVTSKALGTFKDTWPGARVKLHRPPGAGMTISVIDRSEMPFGNIDAKTASVLAPLLNGTSTHQMRLTAVLLPRKRHPNEEAGRPASEVLRIHLTVYASYKFVEGIGRNLSQKGVWLHNPSMPEREVVNPHVPKNFGPPRKSGVGSGVSQYAASYTFRTSEEIRSDVLGMFDKLSSVESLPEAEPNMDLISTKLMSHQKQALYFLARQETPVLEGQEPSNPQWKPTFKKDGSKIWYNVITGHEAKLVKSAMGGIFADMMGLGKTLSLLARICADTEDAHAFGNSDLRDVQDTVERNTKGTLIVCPKSVLSNWDEQIKAHLKRRKISLYTYHGPKREQDVDELAKYDIVITSYTTVATEFSYSNSRFKALGKLNWYRIVLDEAHMIRNQTTSTFHACCALSGVRRWAVTGTPIQNRLEDLGALIKFVKLEPFDEKGSFEKHFLAPFKLADPQVLDNLRLLVDSITLRRSKDKIDLPGRVEQIVRLDFSETELALYDAFAKEAFKKLKAMVSVNGLRGKGYAHMLTAITRLRLLCAHGRELLSDDDMKMIEGLSYDNALDLSDEDNDKPALSESQVYSMFHLLRDSSMNVCSRCSKDISTDDESADVDDSDDNDEGAGDAEIGYMTPCYHVICPACIKSYLDDVAKTRTTDNYATCPVCEGYIKSSFAPITRAGIEAETDRRNVNRNDPRKAKNTLNYSGPHTKVKALVHQLLLHRAESDLLPDDPPIRSVVFSGWTQYLDLIEIALRDQDIGFVRLDGKMSVPARTRVLEQFRTDASISVLLVSIKAGGQGLNFTTANKVYMMEPQFNPGVEQQAIDRVHRLGQKRDVEITKFIMADSFEEQVVKIQVKKMQLASTAFVDGKAPVRKGDAAKALLESLRTLVR